MKQHEAVYNTLSRAGGISLASGIVICFVGIVTGIVMIVVGAKLLLRRRDVLI